MKVGTIAQAQASAVDVAKYIPQKHAVAEPDRLAMTAMKLFHYCQAWHRSWEGRAFSPETILAWASGPVCPALYELHQDYFEIETGFCAKRLRVRNDFGTA
ncbi:type II toxin-antitoxin system antitoxin SocA domain-containing protein [Streptomyces canus]|uniref:type II toxin-antitoxin system antitoxin SocA domain-containing protein n=1 Tax=Streptomyces canus TaxID=58343 RepID=UPI003407A7D0